MTPAEEQGFKIGAVYKEIGPLRSEGRTFTFTYDDGSDLPFFKDQEGQSVCKYLEWMSPVSTTTNPTALALEESANHSLCLTVSFQQQPDGAWLIATATNLTVETRAAIQAVIDKQVFG